MRVIQCMHGLLTQFKDQLSSQDQVSHQTSSFASIRLVCMQLNQQMSKLMQDNSRASRKEAELKRKVQDAERHAWDVENRKRYLIYFTPSAFLTFRSFSYRKVEEELTSKERQFRSNIAKLTKEKQMAISRDSQYKVSLLSLALLYLCCTWQHSYILTFWYCLFVAYITEERTGVQKVARDVEQISQQRRPVHRYSTSYLLCFFLSLNWKRCV
jgi:hypothetical protein